MSDVTFEDETTRQEAFERSRSRSRSEINVFILNPSFGPRSAKDAFMLVVIAAGLVLTAYLFLFRDGTPVVTVEESDIRRLNNTPPEMLEKIKLIRGTSDL